MPPDWRVSIITATLLLVLMLAVIELSTIGESWLANGCLIESTTLFTFPESEKELELAVEVDVVPRGTETLIASIRSQRRRMNHNVGHNSCLTLTFPRLGNAGIWINIFFANCCPSAHGQGLLM